MPIEKADSRTGWNFSTKAHTQVHTPICKHAHTRMHMHVCTRADIHIHARAHTHARTCTARTDKIAVPQWQGVRKRTQTIQTHSQMRSYKRSFQKKKDRIAVGRILCYVTILVPMTMNVAKKRRQLCRLAKWILIHFSSSPHPPFVAVVISLENRQLRSIA